MTLTVLSVALVSFTSLPATPAVWFTTNWFNAVSTERIKMSTFKKFFNDESGATAIEYGLIAAGISVVIITVVQGIGTNLTAKFTAVEEALK